MAPDPHQTLGATLDWSFALLSQAERGVFQQLAVIAGGWTLQAAESVCRVEGDQHEEVLDLLWALVDKSLVVRVESEDDDVEEPR
jgi:predicted ATPase